MDFDQMVLTFDGKVPEVSIKGIYDMEGRILVIPVKGKGPCSMISSKYILIIIKKNKHQLIIFQNFQPTSQYIIV